MKLFIMVCAALLTACQPSTEVKTNFKVPPELADCKFYEMYDGNRTAIVVRCPNSSTSVNRKVSCGKNCWRQTNAIVIEGVTSE